MPRNTASFLPTPKVVDDVSLPPEQRKRAAQDLTIGLNLLIAAAGSGKSNRDATGRNVQLFDNLLEKDNIALDADLKVAEKTLQQGTIKQLQTQLNTILTKLDAGQQTSRRRRGSWIGLVRGDRPGCCCLLLQGTERWL